MLPPSGFPGYVGLNSNAFMRSIWIFFFQEDPKRLFLKDSLGHGCYGFHGTSRKKLFVISMYKKDDNNDLRNTL